MKYADKWLARIPTLLLAVTVSFGLLACDRSALDPPPDAAPSRDHAHDHDHDHHHHHEAPRGGTLVELGDHVAHVEFLLDAETGQLRAYVLDGHAANPVRLPDDAINLHVMPGGDREDFTVTLEAQANPLTGEEPGDTSEFAGLSEELIGLERFEAHLPPLTVRGVEIDTLLFSFPEGNE